MRWQLEFFSTLTASAIYVILYWLLSHLAARSHPVAVLVKGNPIYLTRNGVIDEQVLRRVGISQHDMEESATRHGISDLHESEAVLERGGDVTATRRPTNRAEGARREMT